MGARAYDPGGVWVIRSENHASMARAARFGASPMLPRPFLGKRGPPERLVIAGLSRPSGRAAALLLEKK
jgi:hypothetical protein